MSALNVEQVLTSLKTAMINLGHAHGGTPLNFIQDTYTKYMLIRNHGQNPNVPYELSLLPKSVQDALEGTIPPTETNPPIDFTEYEIPTEAIPNLTIVRSDNDVFIQYNKQSETVEDSPIIYVDGRKIDTYVLEDSLQITMSIAKNFNQDIRIKLDGANGSRNYLITEDYVGIYNLSDFYPNQVTSGTSAQVNSELGLKYYYIDPITLEKRSGIFAQANPKLSDVIVGIFNDIAPNSFTVVEQGSDVLITWIESYNAPIILLTDMDDIPAFFYTFSALTFNP